MAETFSTSRTAEFLTFISRALGKGMVKVKPKMKVVERGMFLLNTGMGSMALCLTSGKN